AVGRVEGTWRTERRARQLVDVTFDEDDAVEVLLPEDATRDFERLLFRIQPDHGPGRPYHVSEHVQRPERTAAHVDRLGARPQADAATGIAHVAHVDRLIGHADQPHRLDQSPGR